MKFTKSIVIVVALAISVIAQTGSAGRESKPSSSSKRPAVKAVRVSPSKPSASRSEQNPKPETKNKPASARSTKVKAVHLTLTVDVGSVIQISGIEDKTKGSRIVISQSEPIQNIDLTELPKGRYLLEISKPGFSAFQREFLHNGIDLFISAALVPAVSYISVSCLNLSDATISIEGVGDFVGAVTRKAVPPGRYRVTVSRKGYQTITRYISAENIGAGASSIFVLEKIPIGDLLANAQTFFREKRYAEASSILNEIIDLEPSNGKALLLLGLLKYELSSADAADFLVKSIGLGESVSMDVKVFVDRGGGQLLNAALTLDRYNFRLDVPSDRGLNLWMFKPDLSLIQIQTDRNSNKLVYVSGRGDKGDGRKSDRKILLYSNYVFLRPERGRPTFCMRTNEGRLRCDSDAEILNKLLSDWSIKLR